LILKEVQQVANQQAQMVEQDLTKQGLAKQDSEVSFTIIHMNDVYEMMPVSGGTLGGVARVATLKKKLQAENPYTYLTMAGDLHGPSGLGLAVVDGKQLAGQQNVAIMNRVGIDYFTFGDHEFDIYTGEEHMQRLAETEFQMISSNVYAADGNPFPNVIINDVITITNSAGASIQVGIFGISEPVPRSTVELFYIEYEEAISKQVAALADSVDMLIALTHLSVVVDSDIATRYPEIDLILGGDDHERMKVELGDGLAPIFKSDSNARSVQVIDLCYDTATDTLRIEDRIQVITDTISDDLEVQAEVDKWTKLGFDGFRAQGIEPTAVIAIPTFDLDGFANTVRNGHSAFTKLMVKGIHTTTMEPDLSFMFSALIRMDDLIPAGGNFTMYDVIRTFPNNFGIVTITMSGQALKLVLDFGKKSKGSGQYILSTENITQDTSENWLVNGKHIDEKHHYRIGTTAEVARDFTQIGAKLKQNHSLDLQQLLVQELKKAFGNSSMDIC